MRKPPKFEYAERVKSEQFEEKYYWEKEGGEEKFRKESGFNWKEYFKLAKK